MARDEPRWHPLLAAVEGPGGVWAMIDPAGHEYGRIALERRGDVLAYRCEVLGEYVGDERSVRAAAALVHALFIRSHTPSFKGYPRFESHLLGNDESAPPTAGEGDERGAP